MVNLKSPSFKHFDAIIFGAGIAGLTATAYMVKGGARVLLCEQSPQVGGLFNSFWRNGYLFDGGIKAIENSSLLLPTLMQLGVQDRLIMHKSPIVMITNGKPQAFNAWHDVESYFTDMAILFPEEVTGLQQVQKDAKAVFDMLDSLLLLPIPMMIPPGEFKSAQSKWFKEKKGNFLQFPRALALMNKELRPYLEQRIHDPKLVNLMCDLFPDGTNTFFGLGYFRMFIDYFYPEGGMQAIPQLLAQAVEEWGAEIRVNTRVEHILTENGRATGVRLANGEEVKAGYVLASSDLNQALTRMLPDGMLPVKFGEKLGKAGVSHSVFNVFLGLDLPPERLNLQGSGHVFYVPDLEGITEEDRISRLDYFAHVPQEIAVPCMHDPKLAPAGKTGLNLSAMTSHKYLGGWNKSLQDYEQMKQHCADHLVRSFEQYLPGLSDHIEFSITSTPSTILNQTSNSEGAIMGWSYHKTESLKRGSLLRPKSVVETPIPNLLTAGQWAFSPGGAPTAMLTGRLAADYILKSKESKTPSE